MGKYKDLVECFEEAGHDVRSYSGRGMYGKECLAVTVDGDTKVVNVILETLDVACSRLGDVDKLQELINTLQHSQQDSMGRGSVIYWPRINWSDVQDDLNSEDEDDIDEE